MKPYIIKYKYENNLLSKQNILLILQPNVSNKKESLNKLIYRFEEISDLLNFLNEKNENIPKFIYDNMNNIHEILYDSDEVINLNSFQIKENLSNYFYLNLLITQNKEIVNYSYSFDFINKLSLIKISDLKKFKGIVINKIILDLIKNFEGLEDYDEDKQKEKIFRIKSDNIKLIKEKIDIFKEIKLDYTLDKIILQKIDDLYSDIIIGLIKSKKIDDYTYAYNIIDELELENIYLTNSMFEKINEELESNKEIIKSYKIEKEEDLLNEIKINFYYILLKYIIKDPIYMYQFPFILDTRKLILTLIKSNKLSFDSNNIKQNIKHKLDFIVKSLTDSEYYIKIPQKDLIQLKEILNYYKTFLFESKREDINLIEDAIKNNNLNYKIYLKDYDIAKKINIRLPLINNCFNTNNLKTENEFNNAIEVWNNIEKMIREKKIKKIRKDIKILLNKYINDENNMDILLKIFSQDIIDFYINEFKNNIEKDKIENKNKAKKNEEEIMIIPPKENIFIINENNKNEDNSNKENSEKSNNINNAISTKQHSKKNENIKKEKEEYIESDSAPSIFENSENYDSIILKNILENSSFLTTFNPNENKPEFSYSKIKYGKNEIEVSYDKFKGSIGNFKNKRQDKNKLIKNYKKLHSFLEEFETRIKTEYKNNFNLRIELKFKDEKKDDEYGIKNISCLYIFYEPITNKIFIFREEDILNNGTNSNLTGFDFLKSRINSDIYKNVLKENNKIVENKNKKNTKQKENKKNKENQNKNVNSIFQNDQSNKKKSFYTISELNKTARKETILEIIRKVEKDSKYNGFIKQLSNGYYIINKSDNNLYIYDIYFNYMMNIEGFKDHIFNICEKINNNEKKENENLEIVLCTKDDVNLIEMDFKKIKSKIKSYNLSPNIYLNCLEIKDSNYICLGYEGVDQYFDLFSENYVQKNNITNIPCFNSIKISENIIALVSNSILPKGKDELIFYNIKTKSWSEIEGYSFVLSQYGLALMQREENEEKSNEKKKKRKKKNRTTNNENGIKMNRILLCACKQYNLEQKNGILIINAELSNNIDIKKPFYNTDYFEVHCICPISKVENSNENYDNIDEEYKKNIKIIETEYFLVGGFDEEKGEGRIKLYKLIYSNEVFDTKIEYLQDIEFFEDENFEGFEGPINCIMQSKITGNILINCYNGEIYLLTQPNINYYLENEFN